MDGIRFSTAREAHHAPSAKMVFDEAGSPSHGQVMHHAWKMASAQAFGPVPSPEMGERQPVAKATLAQHAGIPADRVLLALPEVAACAGLMQQGSRLERRLARPTRRHRALRSLRTGRMAEVWVARAGGSDASSGG